MNIEEICLELRKCYACKVFVTFNILRALTRIKMRCTNWRRSSVSDVRKYIQLWDSKQMHGGINLRNLTEKLGDSPGFFERNESCSSISPFPCRKARGEREQENKENSGGDHWTLRICLEMGAYFMALIASHSHDGVPESRFCPKISVIIV